MNLKFDIDQITHTEFGVGLWVGDRPQFLGVPVVDGVKEVLITMVHDTAQGLEGVPTDLPRDSLNKSVDCSMIR